MVNLALFADLFLINQFDAQSVDGALANRPPSCIDDPALLVPCHLSPMVDGRYLQNMSGPKK